MLLPVKKVIISLPVYTKSHINLGRIFDVNLEIESQSVYQYVVSRGLVRKTFFIIRPSQVISITKTEMVVDDAVGGDPIGFSQFKQIFSARSFDGAVTSDQS